MTQRPLDRLIRPKSIAVFGGKEARRVIEQCDRMGFTGEIWPVHPKLDEVMGRRCYRSVADLPAAPDASFVGVNRALTIDIIRDLAARGAGGAVCYASGFLEAINELADGGELQEKLLEAAGDMPIVGPNCYGFVNALDGALLWPDQHGMVRTERGVAILTQSSNIALNLTMQTRGLPIAYLMTAGNQAQIGLCDLAIAALEDPRVTAVALHVEGFDSLDALQRLGARSRELKKPVVVLKVGRSEAAQRAAVSHTASLSGNDAVAIALLNRLGIGRVSTLPEMIETLKLLHVGGPLTSNAISSMSCSGGEASLMADSAVGRAIDFRALRPEQLPPLRRVLGEMVTLANPLDYHTFVWGDLARQTEAFAAMFAGDYALNLLVLDFPRADRCDPVDWMTTVDAWTTAAKRTDARTGIVATLGENMPEVIAFQLMAGGIVSFCGISETLAAAETAAFIGKAWDNPAAAALLGNLPEETGDIVLLTEAEAKAELAGFGLAIPSGKTASTPEAAAAVAADIGFPVVLKGLGIAHKTEAGAVKLNLGTSEAVLAAAREMSSKVSGYLVEAMVEKPVVELIIGAAKDPVAGLFLTIGAGGILVELLEDTAILLLPTTPEEISEALSRLKISRLLDGYRGGPRGDKAALVTAVASAAVYVASKAAQLEELDLNPLMVLRNGKGAIVADALIRRRR